MRVTPIIKLIVTAYISPQLHGTGSQVRFLQPGEISPPVSVKNLGSDYRMGKTRLTAEVGSEPLAKAREILKREQVTLDDTLQEMLNHIVAHDTAPCTAGSGTGGASPPKRRISGRNS